MVCATCEKKLGKVICPDPWKAGASNTIESGGRKLNENKALSKAKRWQPYSKPGASSGHGKCEVCKSVLHQEGKFCHGCAYTKGVCSMCGKKILDTKSYKQSNK